MIAGNYLFAQLAEAIHSINRIYCFHWLL